MYMCVLSISVDNIILMTIIIMLVGMRETERERERERERDMKGGSKEGEGERGRLIRVNNSYYYSKINKM